MMLHKFLRQASRANRLGEPTNCTGPVRTRMEISWANPMNCEELDYCRVVDLLGLAMPTNQPNVNT
jgi:hypothetical protein